MRGEPLTPREDTEEAALLQKQGDAHEAAHLEKLKDAGNGVVEIARGDLAQNADETRAALAQGSQIIFQGAFLAERWGGRSEEHTSELQSLMRISYAVFCLKKKTYTIRSRWLWQPYPTYRLIYISPLIIHLEFG